MANPWERLPSSAPYILPEDAAVIERHRHFTNLVLDTLPEPIVGGLDDAEVVFLPLNPGFTPADIDVNMNSLRFIELARANLADSYGSDFYYFAGGLEQTGGYKWWTSKLKAVLAAGVSEETLKRKMMCIEYFPYHSVNYRHINTFTPSQLYSFELVKEAMRRRKIIVIMRSKNLWIEAIPELRDYNYMTLNSAQNVAISPKNIGELNFKAILSVLA